MSDEIYSRWKALGLLDGLTEGDAYILSGKYQELAEYLLQNEDDTNVPVEVLAFPILRRAFQKGLKENYSPEALCKKIKKEYAQETQKIIDKGVSMDAEAEFCAHIANYFSEEQ